MTPVATRVITVGGWSAAAALVAHGGPALALDPRWLAVALAGSLAAAAGLAATGGRAVDRHVRLARLASGDLHAATATGYTRSPMPVLLGAMLACQGAAHLALLAAGVHAAGGQSGSLALHAGLAALGAIAMYQLEGVLERLSVRLAAAVSRVIELLTASPTPLWPAALPALISVRMPGCVRLRGPPPVR